MTFTYTDAEMAGRDERYLTVGLLVDSIWQDVPDCVDTSVPSPSPCVSGRDPLANTITVVTYQFGTFCIFASAPSRLPAAGGGPAALPGRGGGPADAGFPWTGLAWLLVAAGGAAVARGGMLWAASRERHGPHR